MINIHRAITKVLVVLLTIFCVIVSIKKFYLNNFKIVEYELEGKKYKLYLADTPYKWQKGLMYVKNIKDVDGLLFVFPDSSQRVFYNKNTYLDLEVYWINGSSVVGKNFLPSIKKTGVVVYLISPSAVDKVVEIVKK